MNKSCEQVVVNMIQQSISVQYSVHNQSQFWRGFKVFKAQYYSDYEYEQGSGTVQCSSNSSKIADFGVVSEIIRLSIIVAMNRKSGAVPR